MRRMSGSLGPAAAAVLFLASAGHAQDAAPAPSEAAVPQATGAGAASSDSARQPGNQAVQDPHEMLPALSGGPAGSPTAQRGNPVPGTSTSIPTVNPATVRPLEQQRPGNENVAVEDTGIEGQCDPVVSIGCPALTGSASAPANAAVTSAAGDAPGQPEKAGSAEATGAAQ